jgi:hypothetical protein
MIGLTAVTGKPQHVMFLIGELANSGHDSLIQVNVSKLSTWASRKPPARTSTTRTGTP